MATTKKKATKKKATKKKTAKKKTAKKKTAKKKAAKKPAAAPRGAKARRKPSKGTKGTKRKRPAAIGEHGTHRLTRTQLQKWRMLEAEAKAAEANFRLAKMVLSGYLDKYPDVRGAYNEFTGAKASFDEALAEVRSYVTRFCDKMDLDPRRIAIDDESGLVREIEDPSAKT